MVTMRTNETPEKEGKLLEATGDGVGGAVGELVGDSVLISL